MANNKPTITKILYDDNAIDLEDQINAFKKQYAAQAPFMSSFCMGINGFCAVFELLDTEEETEQ